MSPPEAYTGALGLTLPAWTATIGAHRPLMRLRQDAIPVPVPRLGAGKTSGVLKSVSGCSLPTLQEGLTMRKALRTLLSISATHLIGNHAIDSQL